jgi:hypothetical protein
VPKVDRKQAAQLRSELDTCGLSVQDLADIFFVTARSIRAWTTGARRIPKWLMPALRLYAMLSPDARLDALQKLTGRKRHAKAIPRAAASNPNSHPFARIEEL